MSASFPLNVHAVHVSMCRDGSISPTSNFLRLKVAGCPTVHMCMMHVLQVVMTLV